MAPTARSSKDTSATAVMVAVESFAWRDEVVVRGERRRADAPVVTALEHMWLPEDATDQELAAARAPLYDRGIGIEQAKQARELAEREARTPRVTAVDAFEVPFSELRRYDPSLPSWGTATVNKGDVFSPTHPLVRHSPSKFVLRK